MPSNRTISEIVLSTDPCVQWLVPNLIAQSTLIALAGMPGTGKSFLSYTIGMSLAAGIPLFGQPTQPSRVLYFDQENAQPDSDQYWRWAWIGLGRPDLDTIDQNLTFAHFKLGSRDWSQRAIEHVQAAKPHLIIIDTTTPACCVIDENDNGEASNVINQIRMLMNYTTPTASCIALKHAKIDNESGVYTLRGAKAWEGAVDGVLFQTRAGGKPRADSLKNTILRPHKVRAFGLRHDMPIRPDWVERGEGLKLDAALVDQR